ENASTKSQDHLLAISQRSALDEAVTDILVRRGRRDVVQSVAENPGAKFSDDAHALLVGRSAGDSRLAQIVGNRQDLPSRHSQRLLHHAPPEVRRSLVMVDPPTAGANRADTIGDSFKRGPGGERQEDAAATNGPAIASGEIGEKDVAGFAVAGRFRETMVALAQLCNLPIDVVTRAMRETRLEMIMVMGRAAGFSWETAEAIVLLCAGPGGIAPHVLEQSRQTYLRLTTEMARQVLQFQRRRQGAAKPAAL